MKILNTRQGDLYKSALNVYTKQHEAIAENVANANTSGYIRTSTDFSSVLKDAKGNSGLKTTHAKHLAHPSNDMANNIFDTEDTGVDLTQEMTIMAENQIRHEFVSRMLNGMYRGISNAIIGHVQ